MVLVLGLTHNWLGITAAAAQSTQELFLVSWLAVIVMPAAGPRLA